MPREVLELGFFMENGDFGVGARGIIIGSQGTLAVGLWGGSV